MNEFNSAPVILCQCPHFLSANEAPRLPGNRHPGYRKSAVEPLFGRWRGCGARARRLCGRRI